MRSLQVKKQLLAFFMPGFLIGILYANCFLKQTIVDTNLFDIEILKKYTEINSFGNIYFLYIVQIRLIPFALLMALAFTKIKKLLMPIVVSGSAFSIGILLTVAVIKMGMKGYKGFRKGLICKGKQYAENTIFEESEADICVNGMHFCKNPMDVLDSYP